MAIPRMSESNRQGLFEDFEMLAMGYLSQAELCERLILAVAAAEVENQRLP